MSKGERKPVKIVSPVNGDKEQLQVRKMSRSGKNRHRGKRAETTKKGGGGNSEPNSARKGATTVYAQKK